ncbi:MAG: hypothetical protein HS050_01270 [Thaumarchaeota archaeon]|nr:hypothetical protein [Nitrososphaerota archaeon]
MFDKTIRIPVDRVGSVVGKSGKTKLWIEEKCYVNLDIDSRSGEIHISTDDKISNPLLAVDLIQSIAHGFSKVRASNLLDEDKFLSIIDLTQYYKKSSHSISRIKSRVIGQNGKARQVIEELSDTNISVYGHSVSIIGSFEQIKLVENAINLLISGAQHKTVYALLQKSRTQAKLDGLQLWEDGPVVEN